MDRANFTALQYFDVSCYFGRISESRLSLTDGVAHSWPLNRDLLIHHHTKLSKSILQWHGVVPPKKGISISTPTPGEDLEHRDRLWTII